MAQIFISKDRLYMVRAGKEIHLESATIFHDKKEGTYKITIFPEDLRSKERGKTYIQKTYPIPGITLKQVQDPESLVSRRGVYYHLKHKNFYINYYVK